MALLFGNYELTIDEKNRMLIPSEIRRSLKPDVDGEGFFVVNGTNGKLWLYTARAYEESAARDPVELAPDVDQHQFDIMWYATASRVEPDKQGRVLLPEKELKRAGLDREVTLIGVKDHMEIWNRAEWELYREQLLAKRAEIERARRMKAQPSA